MASWSRIDLSEEQRRVLNEKVSDSDDQPEVAARARILLAIDTRSPERSESDIARDVGCELADVAEVRQRFLSQGLQAAISQREVIQRKLNASFRTAISCVIGAALLFVALWWSESGRRPASVAALQQLWGVQAVKWVALGVGLAMSALLTALGINDQLAASSRRD